MTLKAAILTALPPESILSLAQAAWPEDANFGDNSSAGDNSRAGNNSGGGDDSGASLSTLANIFRQRLRRSPRITLEDTLAALNKESLVTICRVVGIDHRGRRDELTIRLIEFDAQTRRRPVASAAKTPRSASAADAARMNSPSPARSNSRKSR